MQDFDNGSGFRFFPCLNAPFGVVHNTICIWPLKNAQYSLIIFAFCGLLSSNNNVVING